MARENGRNAETGNVAAAGRELIYTSASFSGQSDFAFQKSCICVTLVSQNPPVLLPRKSVCCHTLPHRRVCRHPLFRVSRKQRYNALDFAKQNRVPTGMLRAPIGNPVQKGIFPLQSLIFFAGAYANCKSNSLKIKKRCNLRHIIGRKLQRFITLNVNKKWAAVSTALI